MVWGVFGHTGEEGSDNMVEQDTIRLLRECDAGIKMGIASIDDVLEHARNKELHSKLKTCRDDHETLQREIQTLLGDYQDEGKNPNPIAKGMSWMKTNVKLGMEETDATIADLMTDGCNMGIKSLRKYLNQYQAADEKSRTITKKLIRLEETLAEDLQKFL